jgi:AsmA protein
LELDELDQPEGRPILFITLAVIVVVIGLVVGFGFWTLNAGSLKPRLIEAVERATGRTLTISGQTRFTLSLSPGVSMEDVTLTNPPGYSRPNLITVARVDVGLELLPLLQHRLEVDHVTLVRPDVLLETNSAGRGNWSDERVKPGRATAPATTGGQAPAPETTPIAPPGPPTATEMRQLSVWFRNASVVDGLIGWRDGKTGQTRTAQLTQLTLDAPPGGPAELTGTVAYEGRTISLTGHAEPTDVADSAPGTGPWPVTLKLASGDATMAVDGQVEQPLSGHGYVLAIDATVPNPSSFTSWFPKLPLALLGPVSAHAELSDDGGATPTISKAQITVAAVDLGILGDGATLQNLTIGAHGNEPIRITGGITRDGIDSGINGVIGDLHWLSGGATAPVAADLEWNAGSARASLKGTIEAPARLSGFALDVSVSVPKPLQVINNAPPALRAIGFQTRLTDAPGPVPFQFTSNAGDLTGTVSVSRLAAASGARFSVDGQVASQRLDLDMLLAHPSEATAAPADVKTTSGPSPGEEPSDRAVKLIPDTKLPFDLLHAFDADLKMTFADVRFDGVDIRNIDGVAVVKDGQLRLDPFTIAAPDQRMSGKLLADAAQVPPTVQLSVNAPAIAMQPLLGVLGLPAFATGTAQVQADLTGTGDTPHAIAASLNGWAGVAIEGGQLDTKMMNAWLNRIQPLQFSGPDMTELRCFALRADLKSGVATIEPVALNTPALIVDGNGDVDLGRETLALQMRPRAKIGGTGIAVPVRVSGPIREPSAKIDISGKALMHGGFGGLLLGGKDVMGAAGGGDPCPQALTRARATTPVPAQGGKP